MSSDAETTGRQSSARRMADSTDLAENPLVDKLLVLLRKNEWIQADNFLKTLSKGSPEIDYSQVGATRAARDVSLVTHCDRCLYSRGMALLH